MARIARVIRLIRLIRVIFIYKKASAAVNKTFENRAQQKRQEVIKKSHLEESKQHIVEKEINDASIEMISRLTDDEP